METFTNQAQSPAVETDALLLAIAGEHAPVDYIAAWAELDRLATALRPRSTRSARLEEQAEALIDLFGSEGFRRPPALSPDDVLLDAVLRRRQGHPLLLVSILAEIGRRVGFRAAPIRAAEDVLAGLTDGKRAIAIDPIGLCSSPPRQPRWLCPHEVAFYVLGELSELLEIHGRIAEAVRAARLRLELPISAHVRRGVEFELAALRARLN
jgi:hypothetical protein